MDMETVIHKADTRGLAKSSWLTSYHTFSFADYNDPDRMRFGTLRVLNDDTVMQGKGFSMHSHENMEIISIPLEGALAHKDSMGYGSVIRKHDVQIMSAGTGIYHSEYNQSHQEPVKFLQLWIFPKERNIHPRYEQMTFHPGTMNNRFQLVVSPRKDGESLWINQDAWISLANFEAGRNAHYSQYSEGNDIYLFVIEGSVKVEGEILGRRDGMGICNTKGFHLKAVKKSYLLLLEIPEVKF